MENTFQVFYILYIVIVTNNPYWYSLYVLLTFYMLCYLLVPLSVFQ